MKIGRLQITILPKKKKAKKVDAIKEAERRIMVLTKYYQNLNKHQIAQHDRFVSLKASELKHNDRLEILEKSFDTLEVHVKDAFKDRFEKLETEIRKQEQVIQTMAKVLDSITKRK